jgi:hypothetical protein
VHQEPPADERPHVPSADTSWQESFVLAWWDGRNGVGGYHRVGHEPNLNGGESGIWQVLHTPGESFFRNGIQPITPADHLPNGFGAASCALAYEFDGKDCLWRVRDDQLELSLRSEDFHPAIDGYMIDGKPALDLIHSNHVEVACRVKGRLTAKGRSWEIDGLGMRDHGWGPRNWRSVWAHRWVVGAFGPDNSFCAVTMLLSTDKIKRFGWVVRGDKLIHADDLDIVAYMGNDGCSNRGGCVRMNLSTGEKFEVQFEPVGPPALFHHRGLCCVDTLSRVRWGDRIGWGSFETSTNPQAGARHPQVLDGGLATDGWHKTSFGIPS